MGRRRVVQDARRDREFEAFVAGAAGRLMHAATLLTAEPPDHNPHARRLLTLSLAHTYACWDGLRGEDPYDRTRGDLATRFSRSTWRRPHPHPDSPLARLSPQERLVLVLRLYEGVAEEQAAALLGLPRERVRTICDRAAAHLLHPRSTPPVAKAVSP
ncbi:sigma factor-like helix-turn-helix DNA-binding protein [Streptomyces sp. AC550_RSS872]|uniref:sigma factor-like helix-turn-helix DNA-binding protein n=1 Tax=Streptomyces sp. AC550_RSS872 TaxID=2823689 RepID=UPI0027E52C98|nr:sigma factor-like helix-turn-helix DNA-binding protein [Streptomyces sp. AC550_RSS872]